MPRLSGVWAFVWVNTVPFGPYTDFKDCVGQNQDKESPEGFCAWLEHKETGKWPSENSMTEAVMTAAAKPVPGSKYQATPTRAVANVEVFATGTWTDSRGKTASFDRAYLETMIATFEAGNPSRVPLKVGHTDDDFNKGLAEKLGVPVAMLTGDADGQGALGLGQVSGLLLRDVTDAEGKVTATKLLASFNSVPESIADLIEGGQFVAVSSEIAAGEPQLLGVALLGAELPAVDSLKSLASAAVFQVKPDSRRLLFALNGGQEAISPDDLLAEFASVTAGLEPTIKDKRGAPIFRALLRNVGQALAAVAGAGSHPQITGAGIMKMNQKATATTTASHAADKAQHQYHTVYERLRNLRWMTDGLGLSETATLSEIIAALQELETQTGDVSPDGGEIKGEGEIVTQAHTAPKAGANKFAMSDEDMAKILEMLGLPAEDDAAAIMSAITAMKTAAQGQASGEPEGGEMPMLNAKKPAVASSVDFRQHPDFLALQKQANQQSGYIKTLERERRVSRYTALAESWTAVAGDHTALAARLADVEEKVGKAEAEALVKEYESVQKAAEGISLFEPLGRSISAPDAAPSMDNHPFLAAVKKHSDENKLSWQKALAQYSALYPDAYREFRQDQRAGRIPAATGVNGADTQ